jgi:hypothetical protein
MTNKHFLIIEDRVEEQEFARQTALTWGIEARVVGDFETAIEEIQTRWPRAIASDLFFPSGNINQEPYIQRVLPFYEAHLKTFKPITSGPLVMALEHVFGGNKDKTKTELWEEFIRPIFLKNWREYDIEEVKDAYFGIEFYSKYVKLQKQIEAMKQGIDIPYGIFLRQEVDRLGFTGNCHIPFFIVTSTNHHDVAFEPIRDKIGIYDDGVDEAGHKDWGNAFKYLLEYQGGKND